MPITKDIADMESRLAAAGSTVKALCEAAEVNQSTWTRWKSGSHAPNMTTWQRVVEAHSRLIAPANGQAAQ